jgi:hypothetical protein
MKLWRNNSSSVTFGKCFKEQQMKNAIYIVVLVTSLSSPVFAGDGHSIYKDCSKFIKTVDDGKFAEKVEPNQGNYCGGLVTGIYKTLFHFKAGELFGDITLRENYRICPPGEGLTTYQTAKTVVKFLQRYPQFLKNPDHEAVYISLITTYPCS